RQRVRYLPGLELRQTEQTLTGATTSTPVERLQVLCLGAAGRQTVRVLHWELGQPETIANDQWRVSLNDQIGSSMLELDAQADILSWEEYYPYGGTAVWSARSDIDAKYKTVRYSGKERDATGLYYYGFRYYAPWLGRWINPDPAGTVDGLNLFCMVGNNPITFFDVAGLLPKSHTDNSKEAKKQRAEARGPMKNALHFVTKRVRERVIKPKGSDRQPLLIDPQVNSESSTSGGAQAFDNSSQALDNSSVSGDIQAIGGNLENKAFTADQSRKIEEHFNKREEFLRISTLPKFEATSKDKNAVEVATVLGPMRQLVQGALGFLLENDLFDNKFVEEIGQTGQYIHHIANNGRFFTDSATDHDRELFRNAIDFYFQENSATGIQFMQDLVIGDLSSNQPIADMPSTNTSAGGWWQWLKSKVSALWQSLRSFFGQRSSVYQPI
ncbi:RHS repeat-associated core domain-containing protein, partial [Shewanella sp. S23-S33]|uniref:RHS repeat-associated core domain-containing protein n=1 Tax=Shewanella sp. S23-S33 TaxID=3342769 RepID=UPI00372D0287